VDLAVVPTQGENQCAGAVVDRKGSTGGLG
jgi:hypothetical protein